MVRDIEPNEKNPFTPIEVASSIIAFYNELIIKRMADSHSGWHLKDYGYTPTKEAWQPIPGQPSGVPPVEVE
jgi:hypothetical protein